MYALDMTPIIEWLQEHETDILLLDGFDDAIIGTVQRINEPVLAVYDWHLLIEVLLRDPDMGYDDAVEYVDYNILGSWVGSQTPLILNRPEWVEIRTTVPEYATEAGADGELPGQLSVFDADPNWDGVAPI